MPCINMYLIKALQNNFCFGKALSIFIVISVIYRVLNVIFVKKTRYFCQETRYNRQKLVIFDKTRYI
jgi:hypothetical protein